MKTKETKQNRFATLSSCLESEGLIQMWDMTPIAYGQTRTMTFEDGSKYGHFISITRFENGDYERPIHYKR
jgi:hypothetical protein